RLVHLRLDLLAELELVVLQELRDVGAQLARLRVNDLVLFLDTDGERRRVHGWFGFLPLAASRGYLSSNKNVGTVEPQPAVTFNSASVEMRVKHPSIVAPKATNGSVSSMRSIRCSLPPS